MEKKDFITLRLILPSSIQGATGVFQSKNAVAFQPKAISPELLLVCGDIPTDIPRIKHLRSTKLGIGLILAVGASKKANTVFTQSIEDEEEFDMFSRAFDNLTFEENGDDNGKGNKLLSIFSD